MTTTITVSGMTCQHCVASVKEEVGEIAGVTAVNVDLESGRVDIESEAPLEQSTISEAVQEAGYQLVEA